MVRPKKHLGQHFLMDPSVAAQTAAALTGHGEYETVIELGPGTGALTQHLLQRFPDQLQCIEVDDESIPYLKQHFPQLDGRLHHADVLKMDLTQITEAPIAVVGNFPYNISTQIIFKVLDHRDQVKEVVGMFQKEVADRICAPPGSRTYGVTSVFTQAWYTTESLFDIPPEAFNPPPKVTSSVIRLQRNDVTDLGCDEKQFKHIVKTAFNQRRKTLRNSLSGVEGLAGRIPEELAGLRAERLGVAEFVGLTRLAAG